jgi:hypothetical protein
VVGSLLKTSGSLIFTVIGSTHVSNDCGKPYIEVVPVSLAESARSLRVLLNAEDPFPLKIIGGGR